MNLLNSRLMWAALLFSPLVALAQAFPAKPVKVIVPHPTGGGPVDEIGRAHV